MTVEIDLKGHVALVTGAGRGVGAAIARTLASAGAKVAAIDIQGDLVEQTADAIRRDGMEAEAYNCDVTDLAALESLREKIESQFGIVDIIVNNVGWTPTQPFLENSPEFIDKIIRVNYLGTVLVCKVFLARLVSAGRPGKVLNISSGAGRIGNAGETVYSGAKGAVNAFTKSLAREMARHNIIVNCIAPGAIDTPLLRLQSERMLTYFTKTIPVRRLGAPQDIAGPALFLVSDHAGYITGQILSVDGGLTMVD